MQSWFISNLFHKPIRLHKLKINNIDQNCKTPSSGDNVKNGWWRFLSASSPNPCIPILNRALNPENHHVSLKWQIPTSSRFLQRYTLLSCSSFAIKLWEGRFQRSPRFERDSCDKRPVVFAKSDASEKTWNPKISAWKCILLPKRTLFPATKAGHRGDTQAG